jgi:hypothetical protein
MFDLYKPKTRSGKYYITWNYRQTSSFVRSILREESFLLVVDIKYIFY